MSFVPPLYSSHSNDASDTMLKLPPISAIDDFLPSRSWAPPSHSLPTPTDQWKSPPYDNRAELSRDTLFLSQQNPLEQSYFHRRSSTSSVEQDIEQVIQQCNTLCHSMTQHQYQFMHPPATPWLDDMIGRANEVLNALLRLRKRQIATEQHHQEQQDHHPNRQRKRGKRPPFQGRCHSCHISETPEWRRGPDGARTLCNACGLHYAKLTRKQQQDGTMLLGRRRSKLTPPADC